MNVIVLKEFESEVEARVVESFLRALGFDVKLLDTHSPTTHRYRDGKRGLRLLVRADEADKIRSILEERLQGAHLRVIDDSDSHLDPQAQTALGRFVAGVLNFFGKN